MRITCSHLLIICFMTGISFAEPISAQEILNKKISLSANQEKLTQILKSLAKANKVPLIFNQEIVQMDQKISLSVKDESLRQVLDNLLPRYGIGYKVYKEKIILYEMQDSKKDPDLAFTPMGQHQGITIKGKVIDQDQQPLPGVSIKVKGTTTATKTDTAGNYSLQTKDENATLLFSYLGFETQEVLVNGRSRVDLQMQANLNSLSEVVVVGYGTQKREDVTGAVARANLEDFRNAPNANIMQSLQGTVPGLNVGQVSSAGSTPSLSIRGASTISGNSDVLIVLDGIQYNGSLESINPDDIATIDVLKDASSTAVYGAQAANGVILITTKRGKKDQKPRITFSSSYATQTPAGNLRPLNRQGYLDHVRDLYYDEAFLAPDYTQSNPDFDLASKMDDTMKDENGKLNSINFDWYDAATHTGHIAENKVGVSGATDKVNYLLSAALTDQSGFIMNDDFKRKSLRVNLETQAADWLKIGLQSFGSFVNKDGAEPKLSSIIQQSPLILPYDADGNLIPYPFETNYSSPFLTYDVDDYERHNYFFANLYAQIDVPFVKGLSYRINFGNNYRINKHNVASEYGAGLTGEASKEYQDYYDYTLDNILTYNRSFKKQDLSVTLLYGAIERKQNSTLARATGFPRLTLGYNSLEQGTNQYTSSDAWQEALNYQMFRVNYKYDEKYLLTATLRRDGFSGFAENHKFGYFPSAALAWIITNESFAQPEWVNYLKLRLGYGVSGNQTSRYYSLPSVSAGPAYVFGDGGSTAFGQQVQTLANANLKWERTKGVNVGLDFTLFKNILNGSFEYYNNTTSDLLFNVTLPSITGFDEIRTNVGEIRNKGVELSLTSQNVNSENVKWSSTLNFSRNQNKILSLLGVDADGNGKEDDLITSNLFIGQPINTYFNYEANGIYQIGEDIPAGYNVGNYRVVDQNNDGQITTADKVIQGRREPSFRIGLLNTFEYKGFNLSVFINSIQGGKNGYRGENNPAVVRDLNAIRYNYLSGINYWSPNNPDGKYARSIVAGTVTPGLYQDRSFIRLQDISLSYNFTGDWVKKLKLQNLNVFVSGKNLATWTKWEGWDPETNDGLTINGRPVLKGYAFGVNLTF